MPEAAVGSGIQRARVADPRPRTCHFGEALISRFGFRVEGLGFWVEGIGFRVSGRGYGV